MGVGRRRARYLHFIRACQALRRNFERSRGRRAYSYAAKHEGKEETHGLATAHYAFIERYRVVGGDLYFRARTARKSQRRELACVFIRGIGERDRDDRVYGDMEIPFAEFFLRIRFGVGSDHLRILHNARACDLFRLCLRRALVLVPDRYSFAGFGNILGVFPFGIQKERREEKKENGNGGKSLICCAVIAEKIKRPKRTSR